MQEIIPGVFHYKNIHPNIKFEVSSYYLYEERVLIDPIAPDVGIAWFDEQEKGPPTDILLSCRHHYRASADFVKRYDATVHCVKEGMHEFSEGQPVEPFEFGDELPGGVTAKKVNAISPDETAFYIPVHKALACADGVMHYEPGKLSFVPEQYMDDPAKTKAGLIDAYRELLELDFETLLLAHGEPIVGDGKQKLREFVEERGAG